MDNTILMYTSDNGAHFAANERGHQLEFFDSNGPLKGGKRDLYEGGVRVPLLVCWKDKIKPGSVTNHISAFQDLCQLLLKSLAQKNLSNQMEFLFTNASRKSSKKTRILELGVSIERVVSTSPRWRV